MLNDKSLRRLLFIAVAVIHIAVILFFAVTMNAAPPKAPETARVMKLTDLAEIPPEVFAPPPPPPPRRPPPPPAADVPVVESIAETIIETETEPEQVVVDPGALIAYDDSGTGPAVPARDEYLPIHLVSEPPKFDDREIRGAIVYPPIAQRSGIEGRVILELFVDRNGVVQQVTVLREEPEGRGFGEAAVRAFTGRRGTPAYANGEPVSARYRYPVSFTLR